MSNSFFTTNLKATYSQSPLHNTVPIDDTVIHPHSLAPLHPYIHSQLATTIRNHQCHILTSGLAEHQKTTTARVLSHPPFDAPPTRTNAINQFHILGVAQCTCNCPSPSHHPLYFCAILRKGHAFQSLSRVMPIEYSSSIYFISTGGTLSSVARMVMRYN